MTPKKQSAEKKKRSSIDWPSAIPAIEAGGRRGVGDADRLWSGVSAVLRATRRHPRRSARWRRQGYSGSGHCDLGRTKTKTVPWDSAKYLKTDEDIADYLEAVFEDGDPALISYALGVVARAKGMTQIAQAAGLGRESLYKALSPDGNPEFATVLKVVRALGLKLKVAV